jgi:hypothetical protein
VLVLNNADVMLAVPIGNLGVTCIEDAGRRPLSGRQTGLTNLIHAGSGHGVEPAELADHDGFSIGFGRFTSYESGRVPCLDSEPGGGSAWGSSFGKSQRGTKGSRE